MGCVEAAGPTGGAREGRPRQLQRLKLILAADVIFSAQPGIVRHLELRYTSDLYHPNREQRSGQMALDSRRRLGNDATSRQRVNGPTLRGDDDNEDNAVSPQPFGPMGVAGDIFVASRRRCEDIDFRLAPRSPRQDPSALLPIRVVQVTSAHHRDGALVYIAVTR